jgi:hypothetical protein
MQESVQTKYLSHKWAGLGTFLFKGLPVGLKASTLATLLIII